MENSNVQNILIIGASGGLASILINLFAKDEDNNYKVFAIDSRELPSEKVENVVYKKIRYSRNNFETLFRERQFDCIYHLARLSHTGGISGLNLSERMDQNLVGTKRILDLSLKYGVKKVVVLSTYHVYGALQDNPVFIKEDSPLRASIKYPELRDVVEMDQIVTNWMWKNQSKISTIVLRPCSIIGPLINNSMNKYLTSPFVPLPIDFNPTFQYIYELDMAYVLFESIQDIPTGVYNVAPDEVISIREAKKVLGHPTIPVPIFMVEQFVKAISSKFWSFPKYLIDYIKFPCIIDGQEIKRYLKRPIKFNTREAVQLLKQI